MVDDSPDTSYLGEYATRPTSQFSIDRAHSEDCPAIESNHRDTVDRIERIIGHLDTIRSSDEVAGDSNNTEWESLDEAIDLLIGLQDESMECDCSRKNAQPGQYRYFNPSFNYVTREDKIQDNLTPEEVRKYVRQDYERMERLNAGDWCYIGVRAEAEIALERVTSIPSGVSYAPVQTITSGGLWGIESDSDRDYLEYVQKEELAELKTQLLALGFSRRAISQAFKSIEEVSE